MWLKDEIQKRINYREFYGKHVDLKSKSHGSNGEVNVLCPFHQDKMSSLSVNLNTGLWNCHAGCGGGWVVQFYAKLHSIDWPTATKRIAEEVGIALGSKKDNPVPKEQKQEQQKPKEAEPLPMSLVESCAKALENSHEWQKYLAEQRGISPEVWKKYHLGVYQDTITIPVIHDDNVVSNIYRYNPKRQPKMMPWSAGRPVVLFPSGPVKSDSVVICEGKFDGMCLESKDGLEWRTGTGGCGCWKTEWSEVFRGKDVIIAYDADEPGRKGAEKVALALLGKAKLVRILRWPGFMCDKQHKDITDFFVRCGKPVKDFMELTNKAIDVYSIPLVEAKGNRYFRKDDPSSPLTNFIILIKHRIHTPEGWLREAVLVDQHRSETQPFIIQPESMASVQSFKKFIMSQGDFVFTGKSCDLVEIWKYVFLNDTGKTIIQPDHIGCIEQEGIWLFRNYAIKGNKVIAPDNDGVFWIDGKGFKPLLLSGDRAGSGEEISLPTFSKTKKIKLNAIIGLLQSNFGSLEPVLGLAWIMALIFFYEIFHTYKAFPILFIEGRRRAGKTTLARWLLSFFGLENSTKSISETTQTAISRLLSYLSAMPVHFDEYKNEKKITAKDSFLRGSYNRQSAGKGKSEAYGIREVPVRGALLLSGEETPADNALFSRCVIVSLSDKGRNEGLYQAIEELSPYFSRITLDIIKRKKKLIKGVMERIKQLWQEFSNTLAVDPRTAINYAIVGGVYLAIVGEDKNFLEWLKEKVVTKKEQNEDNFIITEFWEDVRIMAMKGTLDQRFYLRENGRLYLWFSPIYKEWVKYARNGSNGEIPRRMTLLNYLKKEDYVLETNFNKRLNGGPAIKTIVIDVEKAPDSVKAIESENHG